MGLWANQSNSHALWLRRLFCYVSNVATIQLSQWKILKFDLAKNRTKPDNSSSQNHLDPRVGFIVHTLTTFFAQKFMFINEKLLFIEFLCAQSFRLISFGASSWKGNKVTKDFLIPNLFVQFICCAIEDMVDWKVVSLGLKKVSTSMEIPFFQIFQQNFEDYKPFTQSIKLFGNKTELSMTKFLSLCRQMTQSLNEI